MPQHNLEAWGPSWGAMGVMDAPGWSLGGSGPSLCPTPTIQVAGRAGVCLFILITYPLGLSSCLCCETVGVTPSFPCIAGVLWS